MNAPIMKSVPMIVSGIGTTIKNMFNIVRDKDGGLKATVDYVKANPMAR